MNGQKTKKEIKVKVRHNVKKETERNVADALAYLGRDARMGKIIGLYPKPTLRHGNDPFEALVSAIVYQQLSGKAAKTILDRFHGLFKEHKPSPEEVARLSLDQFRNVGISRQKSGYLVDLSEKFLDGTINPPLFPTMTDDDVREHLIAVKGIGRWTADMFLMFTLHRMDILPTGDLGIQKGFQKLFRLRALPDARKMETLAKAWRPYRTVACLYLWKIIDGDTEEGSW